MRYTLHSEGEDDATLSLDELREANADDPELVSDIEAMQVGEILKVGGGAAALFILTRVE